jgi:hypothetical protein
MENDLKDIRNEVIISFTIEVILIIIYLLI